MIYQLAVFAFLGIKIAERKLDFLFPRNQRNGIEAKGLRSTERGHIVWLESSDPL